ncbi:peptidase [Mycobacterium sp. IDR2000157661]|uniref:peptidase n=1 Tax=Mycobacterium sp. IDR2000157661 TaxID=2867005 RepID=UPI001EEBE466|nr:peptidase [Mycobacterium sp. IDR2000157661]ULE32105.1 peptidase [Mycobacterium sp. IDR2000157661]
MRRSTTSAVTDRRRSRTRLAALLVTELICALLIVGRSDIAPGPTVATPASLTTPSAASTATTLGDGRTARLIGLGGLRTTALLDRVVAELPAAAAAVTAFWGAHWPRQVTIVAAATDQQFAAVGGGDLHTAATTTAERIVFAPGATRMSDAALRTVVRHELFHYAARAATAADAPRWLTEGVADFVARPAAAPPDAALLALPTDAEMSGPDRSLAYDRAWWFARFVADRYGTAALRDFYVRACGQGHPDVSTAALDTLGAEPATLLAQWRQWASG